jgi:hypothetical protein
MNKMYYVTYLNADDETQYGNVLSRDEVFKLRKNKLINIMSVTETSKVQ